MSNAEMSAILGIDIETATPDQLLKRTIEVCKEMSECYEDGSIEQATFETIAEVLWRFFIGRAD